MKNDRFSELWIRLGRVLAVYWASGTLLTCLQVMVILVLGVIEAVEGHLAGRFPGLCERQLHPDLAGAQPGPVLRIMSKAGVSMDRVAYILRAGGGAGAPGAEAAPMTGDIEFSHVSFGYEGQEVLRDVSFTVPAGLDLRHPGRHGLGEIDSGPPPGPALRPGRGAGQHHDRRAGHPAHRAGAPAPEYGPGLAGALLLADDRREHRGRAPGRGRGGHPPAAGIACVDEAITEFPEGATARWWASGA